MTGSLPLRKLCLVLLTWLIASKAYSQACTPAYPSCCAGVSFSVSAVNPQYAGNTVSVTLNMTVTASASCYTSGIQTGTFNMGDGSASESHAFTQVSSGPYTSTLTATHVYTLVNLCSNSIFAISACLHHDTWQNCPQSATVSIAPPPLTRSISLLATGCNNWLFSIAGSTVPVTNAQWSFGDNAFSPVIPNLMAPFNTSLNMTHSYSSPGIYTVFLTGSNICPLTSTLNVQNIPTANFNFTVNSSCDPNIATSVNLAIQGYNSNYGYVWDFNGSSVNSVGQTGTYSTYLIAAINTIDLTVSSGSCSSVVSKTLAVGVPAAYGLNITSLGCKTYSISYSNYSTPLVNPQWAFGDGTLGPASSALTSVVHTYPGAGSYVVSLSGLGIDPCQVQTVINVQDFITPDFGYSLPTLCSASQGILLSIPGYNPGYTYEWKINGLIVPFISASAIYAANLQNGTNTIQLTITNATNCTSTVSKVVQIGSPAPTFNVLSPVCTGDPLSVYNVNSGGGNYSWSVISPASTTLNVLGINPAYTFSTAGTYTVSLVITTTLSSNGIAAACTQSSEPAYVTVADLPNSGFSVSPVSCNNQVSIVLSNSNTQFTGYTINYGDGTSFSGNSAIPTQQLTHAYSPSSSFSMYPIEVTFTNQACTSQQSQNVIINNATSLIASAPTPYICQGSAVPITAVLSPATSGNGPLTYNWTGPGGFTSTLSVISATAGGAYQVTATRTGTCPITLSAGKLMTALAQPSVSAYSVSPITCTNSTGSATLIIPGGLAQQGYIVNGTNVPANSAVAATGTVAFVVSGLVSGENNITIANALSPGCNTVVPVTVTHSGEPVQSVTVNQPSTCNGFGSAALTTSGSQGTVSWFRIENYPYTPITTNVSSSAAFSLSLGSYVVQTIYGTCSITTNFSIVNPVINISDAKGAGACPGGTTPVTLNAVSSPSAISGSPSFTTYLLPANTVIGSGATYSLPAGHYRSTAIVNGCTVSYSFAVNALEPISVVFKTTQPNCNNGGGNVLAMPSGGDGHYSYTWYWNGAVNSSTINTLSLGTLSAQASISVTVKDGSGCTANAPSTPLLIGIHTPVTLYNCGGTGNSNATHAGPCSISACVSGGVAPYTYEWYRVETRETPVVWKFWTNASGSLMAQAGDSGTPVTVAVPSSSTAADLHLEVNADHSLTTVSYPFWDYSSSPFHPVMTPAGQSSTLNGAANDPDNYYTVNEVASPTVETYAGSYSGASGYSATPEGFVSGSYNLHLSDAQGCTYTYSIGELHFNEPNGFHVGFDFVWGMNPKPLPEPVNDPVLNENMIEAAAELLAQADKCAEKQTRALKQTLAAACSDASAITDALTVVYDMKEHHHTLYYYDRAGRLSKTVPPQGVNYLSAADIAAIKKYRADGMTEQTVAPHRIATTYTYNSFGQLVSQNTPDGGTTNFIYDSKNRLRFSQNDKQKTRNKFSYTKYDPLGRVIEVGENKNTTAGLLDFTSPAANQNVQVANIAGFPQGGNNQITKTVYSDLTTTTYYGKPQRYLQNRVSYTELDEDPAISGDEHYTYYSYDSHGNVEWMVQDDPGGIGKNYMSYTYDLISGKVLSVSYNEKRADRFFHRYTYDSQNRLQLTETSRDGELWDTDARYSYYAHGPLKRNELGDDHVQGLDYVYTLNGWIKSVNSPNLSAVDDPGKDNGVTLSGNPLERTAADRFGMVLNYYNGDYRTNTATNFLMTNGNYSLSAYTASNGAAPSLYNGNISGWIQSQLDATATGTLGARADLFQYDLLNRIKQSTAVTETTSGWANLVGSANTYKTSYTYDGNGNILTLSRNSETASVMDDLRYTYDNGSGGAATASNRLYSVTDAATGTVTGRQDLQGTHTYDYDETGNLVKETGVELMSTASHTAPALHPFTTEIAWTVYGKIKEIFKTINDGALNLQEHVVFSYDAAGNRVTKDYWKDNQGAANNQNRTTTWYVRDAQGNVMANYQRYYDAALKVFKLDLTEQPIYGSDRLGENVQKITLASSTNFATLAAPSNGFGTISEYQNWITTTSKTQLLPGGTADNTDNLCQCRIVSMKGSNTYTTTQTAVELLGIANNGIAVAEDLNRQLQFFVVLAKNYLGGQDACLVFDRDGKLMKGTEKINSVDVNCKPIIVSLPNSNTYVVAMLNNNQQPVYHVVNMGLPGYGPIGNMGEVLSANNPLDGNSSITSKHGLHFTGSEDHINGHTMVFDTRYTADPAAAGQGTTDIMAYDFGSSTLTPVANKLYSSYGCGDTKQGQLQISPDGSQLAWWRYTSNLGGFDHRNAEIHTLPLNASKTALSGPVVTRSISAAGSYGNGALEFIKNSSDLLYSQRGLYKENNNGTGPAYDRNVWKYSAVNLSSVRINPNTSSPMISYLFGEIKRGSDGNYYIPQMGKANDQIHAYNNANFNNDISLGDTMFKLTSSLPTQVYKVFEDPTASIKEFVRSVGNKAYELKDHLGNVRVVISDVKQFAMTGSTGNYYLDLQFFPEVKNYTDYYAFGMPMPGRRFTSGTKYRFDYNGKETDLESGLQDYGMRIYDDRIAKFLSTDPLETKFAYLTPYQFASNSPIAGIDLDGMEFYYSVDGKFLGQIGESQEVWTAEKIEEQTVKNADGTSSVSKIAINPTNLNINHNEFTTIANIVKNEGSDATEQKYIAFASKNAATNSGVSWYKKLMSGFSSVAKKDKVPLQDNDGSKSANNVRSSVISVLKGDADPTNGASFWDGTDFIAWGLVSPDGTPQDKFEQYDNISIPKSIFDAYVSANQTSYPKYGGCVAYPNSGSYEIPATVFNDAANKDANGNFKYNTGKKIGYSIEATISAGGSVFWKKNITKKAENEKK